MCFESYCFAHIYIIDILADMLEFNVHAGLDNNKGQSLTC